MSKVEPFEGEPQDETMRAVFAFAEEHGAPGPPMARVMGRCPVGAAVVQAWTRVHFEGTLPHRLKELVRIRMSIVESCGYCSSIQTDRSRAEGVTDELLLRMVELETAEEFSEAEKAALRYADLFQAEDIEGEGVYEALREHFDDDQIVELGQLCGLILGMGRFARSLDVLTWDQACAMKPVIAEVNEGLTAGAATR
jgi:AhpD family alkylhydroperoxidase